MVPLVNMYFNIHKPWRLGVLYSQREAREKVIKQSKYKYTERSENICNVGTSCFSHFLKGASRI